MDKLKDEGVNCYSIMTKLTISKYLDLIQSVYENGGGIEGQREPLKTGTAIRIRKRMIHDFRSGTVLPPIVLGVVVDDDIFNRLDNIDEKAFFKIIDETPKENISIIDGMQRTTAITEAIKDSEDIINREMRVEYWVTPNTNSLIYRMLVLNTGQVPWNLRRQLETVFRSVIKEINKNTEVEILEVNDAKRRSRGGQFQADQVIELFLVFGTRKEKIDTKERLAEEFTKQDFIEATSDTEFTSMFYTVLEYLAKFDKLFDKYKNSNEEEEGQFKNGKDLFASQSACVGFVTAIALKVLGRPGIKYSEEQQQSNLNSIKNHADLLIQKLESMDDSAIGNFLDFDTLNELIFRKSGKAGDFEKEFFLKAFDVLVEDNFSIPVMTPCWRAY
jgi:hypothetical protein